MQIGALAARAGVGTTTIRYYESIGLLPVPQRAANGYRRYSGTTLTQLQFIRRAQTAGLSLRAIQEILTIHQAGTRPCRQVEARAEDQIAAIDHQLAELQRLRQRLERLALAARRVADDDACNPDDICSAVLAVTG
jgi:DNA-binding transcriptional MerR regulator